jgi:phosphoribosylformylglycinamidine synthase
MAMKARVYVTLKSGVLDPQGKAVKSALEALGFRGVQDVRMGKYIEVTLEPGNAEQAKQQVERMCQKLLANTVIETYRIELERGRAMGRPAARVRAG